MSAETFQLTYRLSAKDRVTIHALLDDLSSRRQDSAYHLLSHPYVMPFWWIVTTYCSISWLSRFLPDLHALGLVEAVNRATVLGSIFGVFVTLCAISYAVLLFAQYWRRKTADREGREGVNWGDHVVNASPGALSVCLAEHTGIYRWAAFLELRKTKRFLLLMTTPRTAVALPRDAFSCEVDQRDFCDFVTARIAGAAAGTGGLEPEGAKK